MFNHIRGLLTQGAGARAKMTTRPDDLQMAVAVLLIQAAHMDDDFSAPERAAIERLLQARFNLSHEATEELLSHAETRTENSSQLYPFVRDIVEQLDADGRVKVIEMLWEVAYADGVVDPDEDALLRRVAGLVYVSDRDRGEARKRVLRRLGLAG